MRITAKGVTVIAVVTLAVAIGAALAWSLAVPAERHLHYVALPTESQNLGAKILVKISRRSLNRLERCPTEITHPETPIGFLVAAYRSSSDQEWFRDALRTLLQAGCDVNAYSESGYTPLMSAVRFKQTWVQQQLLSNGADPRKTNAPSTLSAPGTSDLTANSR